MGQRRNGQSDMISVRIPLPLHAQLLDYAEATGKTITEITTQALEAYLRNTSEKGETER